MDHRLSDPNAPSTPLVDKQAFEFECPITVFKAEDAPDGKKRRIAGIISTDAVDRQNERILQDGLSFDDFIANGWFNDNHGGAVTDVLGYGDKVLQFKKDDTLPDGDKAPANCTWVEGYLLDTPKATQIWQLAQALAKTSRRLGYSVEGNIEHRTGANSSVIAKAKVRNVAITHCPVNAESRLEVLARSLDAINRIQARKAMTINDASGSAGPAKPNTPYRGDEGGGQVLARESLDGQRKKKKSQKSRKLSRSEAIAYVKSLMPRASEALARAVVASTKFQRGRGQ